MVGQRRLTVALGEVSLYGQSPVLQEWTKLLHCIIITTNFLFGQMQSFYTGNWKAAVQ